MKKGGVFASVLGAPQNAEKYPAVKVVPVYVRPDAKILRLMAEAVKAGKLVIPIGAKMSLKDAAKAHAAAEKANCRVLLPVDATVAKAVNPARTSVMAL